MRLVVRIFLEILKMWDSYSCAWTWRAIAIFFLGRGSCLKVIAFGSSSWKDTSWAISGFDIECAGFADDYRDYFDVCL